MTASHGKNARVIVNGTALSPFSRSISVSKSADLGDITVFTSAAKEYLAGQKDGTISIEGLFDGTTDAVDEVLDSAFGAAAGVATVMLAGDGDGQIAHCCQAIESSYEISSPVDDIVSLTAELQGDGGIVRAVILHGTAGRTSDGNGTGQDNGASSAGGAAAFLQVTAASGADKTIKVQHSADDTTYADLIAWSVVSANAPYGAKSTVTGTVNRYLRASWTVPGGSVTFHLACGRL